MSGRARQRDDELAEAIVLATFPGLGDPDDIPLAEFSGYVAKAVRYVKWRDGDTQDAELEERMLDILRRR